MKTTEHGIEDSKDIENMHHMRLMTLLQELVRDKGYKGAARVLELDQRTVAECAKTGQLSRRVRQALERALQEGVGSAAARQRERNDKLESRVEGLGRPRSRAWRARSRPSARSCAGEWLPSRAGSRPCVGSKPRGTGAGHAGAGPSPSESGASDAGRKPASRPRERREYPDLVTLEPEDDDEDVFGEAWALIVEWRGMKDAPPQRGEWPCVAGGGGAPAGGGAGTARRPRDDASAGEAAAAGVRPRRADQLAQDRALRHAESAAKG